jgi:hypothetical protein
MTPPLSDALAELVKVATILVIFAAFWYATHHD